MLSLHMSKHFCGYTYETKVPCSVSISKVLGLAGFIDYMNKIKLFFACVSD